MDDGGSPTTGMKKLSNRLMKLFGVDTDDVTEEEIISMVNEGHEQGVLQANEAAMIHNIWRQRCKGYYGAPQEYHCH